MDISSFRAVSPIYSPVFDFDRALASDRWLMDTEESVTKPTTPTNNQAVIIVGISMDISIITWGS